MADRDLTLRLTLKDNGFQAGITKAEKAAEKSARQAGDAWSRSLSAGVKGGLTALQGFASKAKSALMGLTGIAGGIGLGALVDSAIKAQSSFRQLAFAIRTTGDASASLESVKREVQALAIATGQSSEGIAEAFGALANQLGDVQQARDAMQAVAQASTASGTSMRSLVDVMESANQQFGIAGKEAGNVFATIIEMGRTSGLSVEEISARFEQVAASARAAGLEGQEGFQATIALVRQADQSFGGLRKGLPQLLGLFDQLGSKADKASIFQKLGIDSKRAQGGAVEAIKEIIRATGGKREKLEKALGTGQAKLLVDLAADFSKTFAETEGNVKTKTDAALRAFDEGLAKAGKGALTWAEVQKEAGDAMKDPAKQIEVGIERLKIAFTKPEMISALTKLASLLPKFAEMLGKLANFAVENPALAAGAAGGAMFLKGGLEAALMSAFTRGGGVAGKAVEGGMAAGGTRAAGLLGPAFALAAIGIGAAIEQGVKLFNELGSQTLGQALDEARKMKHEQALSQFEQEVGPEGEREITGSFGQKFYEREFRNKEGVIQTGQFETRHAKGGATGAFANIASDAEKIAALAEGRGTGARQMAGQLTGVNVAPPTIEREVKVAKDQSQATARAMAQQLRGQTLNVKVVNPEDIKEGPGFGPKAPAPGSSARP